MSGNPFRRPAADVQRPPLQLDSSNAAPGGFYDVPPATRGKYRSWQRQRPQPTECVALDRKASKTKRVRIQTPPPLSPDLPSPLDEDGLQDQFDFQRYPPAGDPRQHAHTLPPAAARDFVIAQDQRPSATAPPPHPPLEPQTVAGSSTPDTFLDRDRTRPDAAPPRTAAFVNPFARTLAMMEPGSSSSVPVVSTIPQPAANGTALDVDAFKRLLLTGDARAEEPSQFPALNDITTSKNTGAFHRSSMTSFTSSPGTSLDHPSSPDDERTNLVFRPQASRPAKPPPPPPPRPRHGTPAASATPAPAAAPPPTKRPPLAAATGTRTPQTVSFADFLPTLGSRATSATTSPSHASTFTGPPSGPSANARPSPAARQPSDLNKPLPRPPEDMAASAAVSAPPLRTTVLAEAPSDASSNDDQGDVTSPFAARDEFAVPVSASAPRLPAAALAPRSQQTPPPAPQQQQQQQYQRNSLVAGPPPPPPPPPRRHASQGGFAQSPTVAGSGTGNGTGSDNGAGAANLLRSPSVVSALTRAPGPPPPPAARRRGSSGAGVVAAGRGD